MSNKETFFKSEQGTKNHFFLFFVADPPREPIVNNSMTVQEGTSLALHCSTQGSPAPTLTWLKDGELVGTITADELSVLEIVEITPQGDGQYRCLAENEHGRASSSLNITVECECFTDLHHQYCQKVGQRIILTCRSNVIAIPGSSVSTIIS